MPTVPAQLPVRTARIRIRYGRPMRRASDPGRLILAGALATLALSACSSPAVVSGTPDASAPSSTPPPSVATTVADSTPPTVTAGTPSTSAASGPTPLQAPWEPIPDDVDIDQLPAAPPGDLTLDRCGWRSAATFLFDVTWSPDTPNGGVAEVPMAVGFVVGDQAVAAVGTATFEQAGAYTIEATIRSGEGDDEGDERAAGRVQLDEMPSISCFGQLVGGRESEIGSAPLVAAPRPAVDGALDTIEGRAASIDLLDEDAPLLPLAWLYADPDPPEIDRLYIHPTETMQFVAVEVDGACLRVRSDWGDGEDVVEVVQQVGCPPPLSQGGPEPVSIDDDVWDVRVEGSAAIVDAFASELTVLWSGQVAPFDAEAMAFDADRYLDEQLAEYDLVELQRFDWQGGRVVAAMSVAGLLGFEALAVTPDGFNAGSSGVACRDMAVSMNADAAGRGFVVVAARSGAAATIDEDGPGGESPVTIPLVDAQVEGIQVGFHDLQRPMLTFDGELVVVTEADGSPRVCVQ